MTQAEVPSKCILGPLGQLKISLRHYEGTSVKIIDGNAVQDTITTKLK